MSTKHLKTNLQEGPKYQNSTRLFWWGTLVGDAARDRFIIAAPTKKECLEATKDFFPDAKEENIQPVTVFRRTNRL